MKNYRWMAKGIVFGLLLWILMYIVFPQFSEDQIVEPENHFKELLFAIPAGLFWGYYRFVILPKKMRERDGKKE